MRYDPKRGAYRDCPWCQGHGCLQCRIEAEQAYEKAFPNGPKPIASFDISTPDGVAAARKAIGREALEHAFGPDGDGVVEIIQNCQSKPEAIARATETKNVELPYPQAETHGKDLRDWLCGQ